MARNPVRKHRGKPVADATVKETSNQIEEGGVFCPIYADK
jgi:hypothetical protein